jgi:hypothetical protein
MPPVKRMPERSGKFFPSRNILRKERQRETTDGLDNNFRLSQHNLARHYVFQCQIMPAIFLVPLDKLNTSVEHCAGGQVVFLKYFLPVCAYLRLCDVVILPVRVGFGRKGIPMPRDIGPTPLIKRVNIFKPKSQEQTRLYRVCVILSRSKIHQH